VAPDGSDKESGSLANVATSNVLGCFPRSIGTHWRVVLGKGTCTSFANSPPCHWGELLLINGTLRSCMHACPPMSARRSNHAPSFLTFRPGMVSPHTKDLPG